MRAFLSALVVMVMIAAGSFMVLQTVQQTVGVAFSTGGARPDLAE